MTKPKFYLSFARKIFLSILGLVLFFTFSISLSIYYHFYNTSETYQIKLLEEKENSILKSIDYLIDTSPESVTASNFNTILSNKIFELRDINGAHINVFSLENELLLSTEPFKKDYISKSYILNDIKTKLTKKDKVFLKIPSEKGITNLESYYLFRSAINEPLGIINLTFFTDNSFFKTEYYSLLKTLIVVILLISILIVVASWGLSYKLTQRLSTVAENIKSIHLLYDDKELDYKGNDEVSILVDAYNELRQKVKKQSDELLKAEREGAWKEIAKQVAHEIKNPLTPMLLTIQNFNRKFDPKSKTANEEVSQLCESITNQIESLKSISDAFSNFASTPNRRDELLDLKKESEKIIDIFNNLSIAFSSNEEEIHYTMDKVYWNRILTNLISNAKQAIPENRKPKIEIALRKEKKSIFLLISDNGEGISDGERIFEPKFTTKNSGMGLGLAMVRKMLEEYNASISFANNLDYGCTFTINLPV